MPARLPADRRRRRRAASRRSWPAAAAECRPRPSAGAKVIASIAPRAAPADTPSVNGVASGLRSSPWNTTPAVASVEPTSAPASVRGRRATKKICASTLSANGTDAVEGAPQADRRRCRSAAPVTMATSVPAPKISSVVTAAADRPHDRGCMPAASTGTTSSRPSPGGARPRPRRRTAHESAPR